MTVYLLMAIYEYECSSIVAGFKDRLDAEYLLARCQGYRKRPEVPDTDGPEYDEWERKWEQWQKRHPAKNHCLADRFDIVEQEIR